MANLSKLILPVKNQSSGEITNQEFDLPSGGGGASDAEHVSYDNTISELEANNVQDAIDEVGDAITNKHKITRITVNTSAWTTDTSSQSGSTLYRKAFTLNHVYVTSPSINISTSSGTGLPTLSQQKSYDLLQYATVNGTTLTLYANAIPTVTFYIQIEGVG